MKKLYILFLSLITSLICISCKNSFIMEKSEIIVPDCVHGKIEIKLHSSDAFSSKYEIIACPDDGYTLLEENIKIYLLDYNSEYFEDYSEINNTYSEAGDNFLYLDNYFREEPEFPSTFTVYHPIKVSVIAFFTKIQE
mgnify:FL=1